MSRTQRRPMSARVAGLFALSIVVAGLAAIPSAAVSGGTPVPDGTYQFLAKIDVGGVRGCTGALVAPQWLLGASSCFAESGQPLAAGRPPRPSTAIVGRIPLTSNAGQVLPIVDLVPREDRNLVLAKLATPVLDVAPMPLATTAPTAGEVLKVTGFGRTANEWAPDRPHSADFTVASTTDTAMAIAATTGEADPCKGDSGGPELRAVGGRIEAVAITSTSWQHGCTEESETRHGATATRVDNIAGWIGKLVAAQFPDPELNLAVGKTVTASSSVTDFWAASNAVDGQRVSSGASFGWSSSDKPSENHTESITVDLGQSQPLGRIDLYPRSDDPFTGLGFPIDFTIQVSEDNTNWITPVTRTGYARPGATAQPFPLGGRPGRYVKVTGTKLSQPNGAFYMQFAEIEIRGANLATGRPVTTSSSLTGTWAATNAVDGQRASAGASAGWSSGDTDNTVNHTESITVDLGQSQPLGRVDLYARSDDPFTGLGFPIDFSIQVSDDNSNWTTAVTRTGYPRPGAAAQPFPLGGRSARYVKITGTKLSQPNGAFYMQFAEIEIFGANLATGRPVTASSSNIGPWVAANVVDGQRGSNAASSGWSSGDTNNTVNHTESITVDLGQSQPLGRVDLYARSDDPFTGLGFPIDFTIQVSTNNTNWTTVVTHTGYPRPGAAAQPFPLGGRSARYVKIIGTKLSQPNGAFYMQFAEIEIHGANLATGKPVTASSTNTGTWAAANAVDGQRGSNAASAGWSSADANRAQDHPESITVDLGQSQPLTRVDLYPRADDPYSGLGFPIDFTIQLSNDNINWVSVVTRTGYARPSPTDQVFPLSGRSARYVKVSGTKLSQPVGQFYMQLAEIEIT